MGRALIGGLIESGHPRDAVAVAEPAPANAALCADKLGVVVHSEPLAAIERADVIVLAVKPQQMSALARGLAGAGSDKQLYVSVAAGITTSHLNGWLGAGSAIVRCMPNTPALIGHGTAALYANPKVSAAQRGLAENLLNAVGHAHWLDDEGLMDAVTALSGSGPAYFFLFIELLEKIGAELGLPATLARQLALETAEGSARLARGSEHPPATLREQVTSPAGTTERALQQFSRGDLENLIRQALQAARDRSVELAAEVDS